MYRYRFEDLEFADFISGSVYESRGGGFANEPLHQLFKLEGYKAVGTQSGIRRSKVEVKGIDTEAYIVIVNTHEVEEWKNEYNQMTRILKYYGDNRTPGKEIHDTKQKGNLTFKKVFDLAYGGEASRSKLPPIFYFERYGPRSDMKFIGLAVPYVSGKTREEALNVNTYSTEGGTFENYEASFSIIDALHIKREWLTDLKLNRQSYSPFAPVEWMDFIVLGNIDKQKNFTPQVEIAEERIELVHTKPVTYEARLTQNKFRKELLDRDKGCRICGLDINEVLIASHIKPWAKSANDEKSDINNGLILCANHDRLFDRGLISFDDSGNIIISKMISEKDFEKLAILNETKISLSDETKKYMSVHRKQFKY